MINIDKILLPEQEDAILNKAIEHVDFVTAGGDKSDIKFEFNNIETDSYEFDLIVNGLTTLIEEKYMEEEPVEKWPEAVVSVADGATRLGGRLAMELGFKHISTTKHAFDKEVFGLNGTFEADTRVVLVDDVYTRGTNLGRVGRAAAEAGLSIVGATVICDRSYDPRPMFSYGSEQSRVWSLIKHPM